MLVVIQMNVFVYLVMEKMTLCQLGVGFLTRETFRMQQNVSVKQLGMILEKKSQWGGDERFPGKSRDVPFPSFPPMGGGRLL